MQADTVTRGSDSHRIGAEVGGARMTNILGQHNRQTAVKGILRRTAVGGGTSWQ